MKPNSKNVLVLAFWSDGGGQASDTPAKAKAKTQNKVSDAAASDEAKAQDEAFGITGSQEGFLNQGLCVPFVRTVLQSFFVPPTKKLNMVRKFCSKN